MRKKQILFGAGDVAHELLGYIQGIPRASDEFFECVIDNDFGKHGTQIRGLTIFPPEHLLNYDKGNVEIILSVWKGEAPYVQIITQLEKMGFSLNENIFAVNDLPRRNFERAFKLVTPIIKRGYPNANIFCCTDWDGTRFFTYYDSQFSYAQTRNYQYDILNRLNDEGVSVLKPAKIIRTPFPVYLYEWIDGCDLSDIIKISAPNEQFEFGVKIGKIMRDINSITADDYEPLPDYMKWPLDDHYYEHKRKAFAATGSSKHLTLSCHKLMDYVENNEHLVQADASVFLHSDFNPGNAMCDKNSNVIVIDLCNSPFGSVFIDIGMFIVGGYIRPVFAIFSMGVLRGYFDDSGIYNEYKLRELMTIIIYYAIRRCLCYFFMSLYLTPLRLDYVDLWQKCIECVEKDFGDSQNTMPSWYSSETIDTLSREKAL